MNEANYRMDWDDRRRYVYDVAHELLENDSDAFVQACEELDNYNNFLGEDRCYQMWEIDEFFNKPSELLDAMDDFSSTDEYFYFHNGNLNSTDYRYEVYSDLYSVDDVIDALVENYNRVTISENISFDNAIRILFNEDFGIEEDWAYDEDMDEDDEPEETDEEFMERIDNL